MAMGRCIAAGQAPRALVSHRSLLSDADVMTSAVSPIEGYTFRSARVSDAQAVGDLVDAAYRHYIDRIGMRPGPMLEDYSRVIQNIRVTIAEWSSSVVGVVVLGSTDEGFLIHNVAVHPDHQGKGIGRALLELAEDEARAAGFDSIYLFTHEGMVENLALYARAGYVEYDRRSQGEFSLVYMRKAIDPNSAA